MKRDSVLSRGRQVYILAEKVLAEAVLNELPSPCEVYRFISKLMQISMIALLSCFRPLSRGRQVYIYLLEVEDKEFPLFPSPLEVNRFISEPRAYESEDKTTSFRPLSRWIGLYPSLLSNKQRDEAKAFPSPLEVDRFISNKYMNLGRELGKFPSPLEVYRFISMIMSDLRTCQRDCFRPLSRYIGLYHMANDFSFQIVEFPSPLEVYRFISRVDDLTKYVIPRFPSPLEVYRFISKKLASDSSIKKLFPSPLEVYRFISACQTTHSLNPLVSVPSRGIQVYIEKKYEDEPEKFEFPSPLEVYRFISQFIRNGGSKNPNRFRPLSRYIGLYQQRIHLQGLFHQFPSPLEVYRFISPYLVLQTVARDTRCRTYWKHYLYCTI